MEAQETNGQELKSLPKSLSNLQVRHLKTNTQESRCDRSCFLLIKEACCFWLFTREQNFKQSCLLTAFAHQKTPEFPVLETCAFLFLEN